MPSPGQTMPAGTGPVAVDTKQSYQNDRIKREVSPPVSPKHRPDDKSVVLPSVHSLLNGNSREESGSKSSGDPATTSSVPMTSTTEPAKRELASPYTSPTASAADKLNGSATATPQPPLHQYQQRTSPNSSQQQPHLPPAHQAIPSSQGPPPPPPGHYQHHQPPPPPQQQPPPPPPPPPQHQQHQQHPHAHTQNHQHPPHLPGINSGAGSMQPHSQMNYQVSGYYYPEYPPQSNQMYPPGSGPGGPPPPGQQPAGAAGGPPPPPPPHPHAHHPHAHHPHGQMMYSMYPPPPPPPNYGYPYSMMPGHVPPTPPPYPNFRTTAGENGSGPPMPGAAMAPPHPGNMSLQPPPARIVKPKRKRATTYQVNKLNEVFEQTFFPSSEVRQNLAYELGMTPRTVQIWFQNKRQGYRSEHNRSLPRDLSLERNKDSDGKSLSPGIDEGSGNENENENENESVSGTAVENGST